MNDQTSNSKSEQPNAMRRRLTKGGLAAPVVLASLVSKPVLAEGTEWPWLCTLSGQLSGNMSGHTSESCHAGTTRVGLYTTDFSESSVNGAKTILNYIGAPLAADLIFINAGALTLDPGTPATVYQALATTANTNDVIYAQKALVILLNAIIYAGSGGYPITREQAINLFIAACNETDFADTNPNINWNYDQVKVYIDLLEPQQQ